MGEGYTPPAASGGATLPIAESDVTGLVSDLSAKAPLASPTFTGTPTLPSGTVLASGLVIPAGVDITAKLGSSSTTAAAGNDSRITGAAQKSSNLSDLASAATARSNLSVALPGEVGGPAKVVARTTDSAAVNSGNTGSTLTDSTVLLFPVAASELWFVQCFLLISAANATMDFQCKWNVPSGTTVSWGPTGTPNSNLGGFGAGTTGSTIQPILAATNGLAVGTLAGTSGLAIAGVVKAGGTPGNVVLQWAQNTSDAGNLVLLTGCTLFAWKLA